MQPDRNNSPLIENLMELRNNLNLWEGTNEDWEGTNEETADTIIDIKFSYTGQSSQAFSN